MVSLYSGAGGLDLGFARAGFRPVIANDIDPYAIATHDRIAQVTDPRWADAAALLSTTRTLCGDVRGFTDLFEPGMADIVIGGPPCQGFSVAGRMDPDDPRSKHVFDFLSIVATVKPRAFVMENVAALATNKRWADVIASLQSNAAVGYKTQLVVLNAAGWAVPQTRKRMFLIGLPPHAPLVDFSSPPTAAHPPTARETLSGLPPAGTAGNEGICTAKITLAKKPVLRKSPFAGMLFNGQGRAINLDGPSQTLPASMGGNRTPIIDEANLADPSVTPWIVGYHRRLFHDNKPPLAALPASVPLRRLTVEEAAALQTFPTDMPWAGTQSVKFRQIGNAVPPLLGYAVARQLRQALDAAETTTLFPPVAAPAGQSG